MTNPVNVTKYRILFVYKDGRTGISRNHFDLMNLGVELENRLEVEGPELASAVVIITHKKEA